MPGHGIKHDPTHQAIVIQGTASGQSQQLIADQIGCDRSTVSRMQDNPDIQAQVNAVAQRYLLESLSDIVEQDISEIKAARRLSAANIDYLEGRQSSTTKDNQEAIEKYLTRVDRKQYCIKQSIGILTTHAPAPVYQQLNIYNDTQQVISDTVLSALTGNARRSTELPDDVVIDVDSNDDKV